MEAAQVPLKRSFDWGVILWICISIGSSTTVILLMKELKYRLSCEYTISVTCSHLICTWCFMEAMVIAGKIKRAALPVTNRLLLASLVVASIVLMNFNLKTNSIGFYQMSKLVTIPYVVVVEFIRGEKRGMGEVLSLAVLLIGVGLFSVNDVEFNLIGMLYAVGAVLATCHNQMLCGTYQKRHELSGMELQRSVIGFEFGLSLLSGVIIEGGEGGFRSCGPRPLDWVVILGGAIAAVGVNAATFSLIGRTSPVTYNVVGHAKTVLLLVIGYVLYPSRWRDQKQAFRAFGGIVIALIGVFWYTACRVTVNAAKPPPQIPEDQKPFVSDRGPEKPAETV